MRNRRSGMMLAEVSVAVTIGAIVTALAGALFHLVLRADRATHVRRNETTAVDRLAEQFRRDVHRAVSARLLPDGSPAADDGLAQYTRLELLREAGQTSVYSVQPDGFHRETFDRQGMTSREAYGCGRGCRGTFEIVPLDGVSLVCLSLLRESTGRANERSSPLRIEARLAAEHDFSGVTNPGEAP